MLCYTRAGGGVVRDSKRMSEGGGGAAAAAAAGAGICTMKCDDACEMILKKDVPVPAAA